MRTNARPFRRLAWALLALPLVAGSVAHGQGSLQGRPCGQLDERRQVVIRDGDEETTVTFRCIVNGGARQAQIWVRVPNRDTPLRR